MLNDKAADYWFLIASHDEDSVATLLEAHGHADIIIYHMHQAIEKRLKGQILSKGGTFPFVHDLQRLYMILCERAASFCGMEDDIIELNSFQKHLRYPMSDLLNSDDLDSAHEIYQRIQKRLV